MARLGAGIRKRSDGTLEKRFTINGRRVSVYGKTAKEITEKELHARQEIEAGSYKDNKNITLDGYIKEWLQARKTNTKENSIKTYRSIYNNHIGPAIGKRKIREIERREVLELQRQAKEKASITTANYIIHVLRLILNDAMRDEIITRNPAQGIKPIKEASQKATETYHRALTEDEQKRFMQALQGNIYYNFVALLLCTGMRSGEAAALTWQDIDTKENVIHVNKTMTFALNGKMVVGESTKTAAGKRDIPLNDTIKDILRRQRTENGDIIPISTTPVFTTYYGDRVSNSIVNKEIKRTLEAMRAQGDNIEHFTLHALRDTFATRFIEQGGNPQTLKTILGHSSLSMTMDLYAHVLPNTKQQEMNNIKIVM